MKTNRFRFQDGLLVASVFIAFLHAQTPAQAEEKLSALQTALSSTTISGYVNTSAQWDAGTGNSAEHWETRATGISRRTGNSAVWTGRDMIVWGGGSQRIWLGFSRGRAPKSNSWKGVSPEGGPARREG